MAYGVGESELRENAAVWHPGQSRFRYRGGGKPKHFDVYRLIKSISRVVRSTRQVPRNVPMYLGRYVRRTYL